MHLKQRFFPLLLQFDIDSNEFLYLVDQPEQFSCTWIYTAVKDFDGVGHLLHYVLHYYFGSEYYKVFGQKFSL